jgi:serine/threonine protein kinase
VSRFVGPYEVVRELGRGGMGLVLEVRDPRAPERRLALKLIHVGAVEPEALARFHREAELLARVRHPSVVRVHDLGHAPEGPFLVLELVEGETLKSALRTGPLAARRAAEVARELAGALGAIHAAGVLHRDLKPENVLLRPDGRVVLLDFGLAREMSGERLTQSGTILGTPAYMAPEQASGVSSAQLNERVDVYGLGAVLFSLLAGGDPPFTTSGVQLTKQVLFDQPTWPQGVPTPLLLVLQKAMAKERLERYASADELRDDLNRFLQGEDVLAAPPSRRGLYMRLSLTVAGLLLLGSLSWAYVPHVPQLLEGPKSASPDPSPPRPPSTPDEPGFVAPERETPGLDPLPLALRPWRIKYPGSSAAVRALFLGDQRALTCSEGARGTSQTEVVLWSLDPQASRAEILNVWLVQGYAKLVAGSRGGPVVLGVIAGVGRWHLAVIDDLASQDPPRSLELPAPQLPHAAAQVVLTALAAAPDRGELALALSFVERQGELWLSVGGWELHRIGLQDGGVRESRRHEEGWLQDLDYLGDGTLAAAGAGSTIGLGQVSGPYLFGPGGGEVTHAALVSPLTQIEPSPDERTLWIGGTDWRVYQVACDDNLLTVTSLRGQGARPQEDGGGLGSGEVAHNGSLTGIACDPGGARLYTLSGSLADGRSELRGWIREGPGAWRNDASVVDWPYPTHSLDLSPDGRWLLVGLGGGEGAVEVWPVSALRPGLGTYREVLRDR